jgi:hypothetical protein
MSRKILVVAASLFFLFTAIGSKVISSNQGITSQSKSKLEDDATPIQVGVMTEKQKQHSKLYNSYKGNGDLQELVRNTPGDEITITSLLGLPELSPTEEHPTSALDSIIDNADAIVMGVVSDKSSQLNEGRTFIFTDYELAVEEVLKSFPDAPIEPNGLITVTHPGGKILLNGKKVTAVDRTFKPLEKGKRYLLFLKFIPVTGAYQALDNKSSFEINDRITILTDAPVPFELQSGKKTNSFLEEVRASITAYKHRKRGINK